MNDEMILTLLNLDPRTREALKREAARVGLFHKGEPNMSAALRLIMRERNPDLWLPGHQMAKQTNAQ